MKLAVHQSSRNVQAVSSSSALDAQLPSVDDLFRGLDKCHIEPPRTGPSEQSIRKGRFMAERAFRLNETGAQGAAALLAATADRLAAAFEAELLADPVTFPKVPTPEAPMDLTEMLERFGPTDAYFRVLDAMNAPVSNAARVAEAMADSPRLAAFALHLVNGPSYGLSARVESLPRAVAMAGFNEISGLALAVHLFRQLGGENGPYWREAMLRGIFARRLARKAGLAGDSYFAAGLLADVGGHAVRLMATSEHASAFRLAAEEGIARQEAESRIFGTPLSQVGADLLESWDAPKQLVDMVRLRETPAGAGYDKGTCVLHLAEVMAQAASVDGSHEVPVATLDELALDALGLAPSALATEQTTAREQADTLARSFHG